MATRSNYGGRSSPGILLPNPNLDVSKYRDKEVKLNIQENKMVLDPNQEEVEQKRFNELKKEYLNQCRFVLHNQSAINEKTESSKTNFSKPLKKRRKIGKLPCPLDKRVTIEVNGVKIRKKVVHNRSTSSSRNRNIPKSTNH